MGLGGRMIIQTWSSRRVAGTWSSRVTGRAESGSVSLLAVLDPRTHNAVIHCLVSSLIMSVVSQALGPRSLVSSALELYFLHIPPLMNNSGSRTERKGAQNKQPALTGTTFGHRPCLLAFVSLVPSPPRVKDALSSCTWLG